MVACSYQFSDSSDDKNEAISVELSGYKYQPDKQGPLTVQAHERSDRADENDDPMDRELQRRQASEDVDWSGVSVGSVGSSFWYSGKSMFAAKRRLRREIKQNLLVEVIILSSPRNNNVGCCYRSGPGRTANG